MKKTWAVEFVEFTRRSSIAPQLDCNARVRTRESVTTLQLTGHTSEVVCACAQRVVVSDEALATVDAGITETRSLVSLAEVSSVSGGTVTRVDLPVRPIQSHGAVFTRVDDVTDKRVFVVTVRTVDDAVTKVAAGHTLACRVATARRPICTL